MYYLSSTKDAAYVLLVKLIKRRDVLTGRNGLEPGACVVQSYALFSPNPTHHYGFKYSYVVRHEL